MNPLGQIKIPHQAIPAAEWNDRIDPGVTQPKLRPMKSISDRHGATTAPTTSAATLYQDDPWSLTEPQDPNPIEDSDTRFSNWLEELRPPETDMTSPFDLQPEAAPISDDIVAVDLTAAEPTPEAPYQPREPHIPEPSEPVKASASPAHETGPTPTFHSVNQPEHRLETAYFHLRTMGLPTNASWTQIRSRYHEIIDLLNHVKPSSPSEKVELVARRRSVNVAYACLRILSSRR